MWAQKRFCLRSISCCWYKWDSSRPTESRRLKEISYIVWSRLDSKLLSSRKLLSVLLQERLQMRLQNVTRYPRKTIRSTRLKGYKTPLINLLRNWQVHQFLNFQILKNCSLPKSMHLPRLWEPNYLKKIKKKNNQSILEAIPWTMLKNNTWRTKERRWRSFSVQRILVCICCLPSCSFLLTGHWALHSVFKKKDVHGRPARWPDHLLEYEFTILYKSGHLIVQQTFSQNLVIHIQLKV